MKLIAEAIAKGQKLDITYLKASDVRSKRIIKPLLIGEESYKRVEFKGLYAFCEKRQEEHMFRVDRILKIELVSD